MTGPVPTRSARRAAGGAAAVAATAALACGACCVLPFALPAAALAATGGVLAWFATLTPWITALALAAVAAGWIWVGFHSRRTRKRPARSTLLTMAAASAMLAAALAWPLLEGPVTRLLRF